jgi:hypothetical protein
MWKLKGVNHFAIDGNSLYTTTMNGCAILHTDLSDTKFTTSVLIGDFSNCNPAVLSAPFTLFFTTSSSKKYLYVTDYYVIRRLDISAAGTVSSNLIIAGKGDDPTKDNGSSADGTVAVGNPIGYPAGMWVDTNEQMLYFVEAWKHTVRSVNLKTGILGTFAGTFTGGFGYGGDGGSPTDASVRLGGPIFLFRDEGTTYITEVSNGVIRKVDTGYTGHGVHVPEFTY